MENIVHCVKVIAILSNDNFAVTVKDWKKTAIDWVLRFKTKPSSSSFFATESYDQRRNLILLVTIRI